MKKPIVLLFLCIAMMNVSCKHHEGNGRLDVLISYSVNEKPLVTDTLAYTNEAGNQFLVTEIQWFLSNMEFQDTKGNWTSIEKIFYIDTNIPESQTLHLSALPTGKYQKLRFTFGLNEVDNQTGRFSDPPERDMFWPEALGGGYHYMKLNGKYLGEDHQLVPLNIHLGIGQNEDLTQFYQNYFIVELPLELVINENNKTQLELNMNIDNWFRSPHVYNFSIDGNAIMQNQTAQTKLKENGSDVFSIKTTNDMESLSEIGRQIMRMAAPKPHFMTWENFKNTISNLKNRDRS